MHRQDRLDSARPVDEVCRADTTVHWSVTEREFGETRICQQRTTGQFNIHTHTALKENVSQIIK